MAAAEHLLEQRAVALATVFLTRQPGVVVVPVVHDYGYDLEIRLGSKGPASSRIFGVQLKARLSIPRLGRFVDDEHIRLSNELRVSFEKQQARLMDLPFPLLFLVFAMDSDRGFYGWLREPALRPGHRSALSPEIRYASEWGSMTHREIIDLVNRWYDAAAPSKRTG